MNAMDVKVIRNARAPDGTRGSVEGELLTVERPHRLESTWRASWDGFAPERVCFELTPIRIRGAAGTRVTVTHTRAAGHLHVTAMAAQSRAGEWPSIFSAIHALGLLFSQSDHKPFWQL